MYSGSVEQNKLLTPQRGYYTYDFDIVDCPVCSLVQQYNDPDLNIVYAFEKNEGVGEKWNRQYKEFSKFIASTAPKKKSLEIGSGNLKLTNYLWESGYKDISVCDVNACGEEKLHFFKGFFEKIDFKTKFDFIYSSHVFEHIKDFHAHFSKIDILLNQGGYYFISLPNFKKWIEDFYLNAFVQDHIVYPFKENIVWLMNQKGLTLIKEESFEDHSIFFIFKKINQTANKIRLNIQHRDDLLRKYNEQLKLLKEFLKQRLYDCNKKIYIFGAHIFSQIIIAFDVLPKIQIAGILDNSKLKQEKLLYSTNLFVYSPSILTRVKTEDVPLVLVFAGAYEKEIIIQLKKINSNIEVISTENFLAWQKQVDSHPCNER